MVSLILKNKQVDKKKKLLNYVFDDKVIIGCLLMARLTSAFFNYISDCDETYNYLEPIHFLTYGTGMQTWEYSPEYAIRSYLYLWFYTSVTLLGDSVFLLNKLSNFYFLRIFLAFFCSLTEILFYKGLKAEFGEVSKFTLLIQIFSAGMFNSSTAVLPNSFSMYFVFAMLGAYLLKKYKLALLCIGCASLIGWPFSSLICLPIILKLFYFERRWLIIKWGTIIASCLLSFLILIDGYYYGKFIIAPLNIILYNVFTSHGANLYGVESFNFYFINCFLNFNIIFIFALVSPIVCIIMIQKTNYVFKKISFLTLSIISMYVWLILFSIQAHKEERFLFPIYPFICLNSAFAIYFLAAFLKQLIRIKEYHKLFIKLLFALVYVYLSLSRILAIYTGYYAPMNTFTQLSIVDKIYDPAHEQQFTICLSKEWFRYPSSFFLPSKRWRLMFLKSEFTGQLPQSFAINQTYPTRYLQNNFNDQNKEEPTNRYLDASECNFIIDSDQEEDDFKTSNLPYSRMKKTWKIFYSTKLIVPFKSNSFFRAFYVPYFTNLTCVYIPFNILVKI